MLDAATLGKLPIFADLAPRELDLLLGVVRPRRLKAGQVVFRQGDPGASFLVVVSGRVGVYRTLATAEPERIVTLGAGAMIGEMSLIDGQRRSAEVRAEDDGTVLAELVRDDFERLFNAATPFAFKILRHITRQLVDRARATTKRLQLAHEQVRTVSRDERRETASLAARYASEILLGADVSDDELDQVVVVEPARRD
jgi:CRP-like cAMP-binding protein